MYPNIVHLCFVVLINPPASTRFLDIGIMIMNRYSSPGWTSSVYSAKFNTPSASMSYS